MERHIPTVAIIGAGSRGVAYGAYFEENPERGRVVAAAEVSRRERRTVTMADFTG
jgi:hypothetical protein